MNPSYDDTSSTRSAAGTPPGRRRWRLPGGRLLVGLVAVMGLLVMACGGDDAGDGTAPGGSITLVLDWTPNTNHSGVYLAQAEGWYEEAGLDVQIVEPGESGAVNQLASGNAEVVFSYAEQVIPARAEGVPIVSVAAVIQHNTSSLLAPADRGISRPADLAGKTYGGYGGVLENALVRKLVACDGGDPDAVGFVEVGNVDFRVGFDRGDFDVVWVFDGWDVIRFREVDGLAVTTIPFIDHTDCIPDWYTPVLATTEDLIAERPDALRAFMEATARGYRAAMDDPEAAADALLAAAPELDEALVRPSAAYLAEHYADDPAAWGRQDAAVWSAFEAFVREAGLTEIEVDTSAAFTNDLLPAG